LVIMQLVVNGVLTDFKGRVLLRQSGEHDLLPITRPIEPGTLPADTLARAFREDTALIVLPIRLTGLYYDVRPPDGELAFYFRCTMRGGALNPESRAGFFDPPLPAALPARYRQRVDQALHHAGGPPHMKRERPGVGALLGSLFGERVKTDKGQPWTAEVKLVTDAGHGQTVWRRAAPGEQSRLLATRLAAGEAPWEAARRLLRKVWPYWGGRLDDLRLVELASRHPAITFVFAASIYEPPFPRQDTETVTFPQARHLTDDFGADDTAIVRLLNQTTTTPLFRVASGEE
jgi:hypothetical protein